IQPRIFDSGHFPTITQYYMQDRSAVHVEHIQGNIQLPFILSHYNDIAKAGFRARKKEQDMNVTLAIWYWGVDKTHSFARRHQIVRFNVICALILKGFSDPTAFCARETGSFRESFLYAFFEHARRDEDDHSCRLKLLDEWRSGPYDLIQFTEGQRQGMQQAIKTLTQGMPALEEEVVPETFFKMMYSQPEDRFRLHGREWALQFLLRDEKDYDEFDTLARQADAEESLSSGDFLAGFAGVGM
ncbi:hypothetical protein EK21DRAFT_24818, partial [Setomelanomma holmii]